MPSFLKTLWSSVGQKFLMALTGLALVGFIVMHLAGNLSLYSSDSSHFNAYAAALENLGKLKEFAEYGLIFLFGTHIILALCLKKSHIAARPIGYKMQKSKGDPSKSTLGSRNMIITGTVLLAFLILHISQFTLGPSIEQGYATQLKGEQVRDLYRLVHETFKNPMFVGIYVAVMIFLGLHLRHGFWSAFQSLGAMNPRLSKPIYGLALLLALLVAAGFLFIPVWIYMGAAT